MKKCILRICIFVLLSFPLLLLTVPFINDFTAFQIKRELERTPLPPETRCVDSVAAAGKLEGNGNGMQYFGAILIKSTLSPDELEAYYSQFRENEWSYLVQAQTDKAANGHLPDFETINGVDDLSEYYTVYTWGSSDFLFQGLDIRSR